MSRCARARSASGYYHMGMRGSGKRILFETSDDYLAFLKLMRKYADECQIEIVAYCLMSNHIHVVILDAHQHISLFGKKLATSFAMRFNERYSHVGPVFQGRFFSIPIDSDEQLLEAVRYVHQNPAKAWVDTIEDYEWSSYNEYLGHPIFVSVDTVLALLGSTDSFVAFMHAPGSSYDVPVFGRRKLTDAQAAQIMKETLTTQEIEMLSGDSRSKRDQCLRKLRDAGISVAQACRLTGLGRYIVRRAYDHPVSG